MSFWTPERVEILTTMANEGKSASEIGAVVGCSRNAVLGACHRRGMSTRGIAAAPGRPPRKPKVARNRPLKKTRVVERPSGPPVELLAVEGTSLRTVAVETLNVALLDLAAHHCRFPVEIAGEPMRYCGRPKVTDSSYCHAHHALCCVPPTRRLA